MCNDTKLFFFLLENHLTQLSKFTLSSWFYINCWTPIVCKTLLVSCERKKKKKNRIQQTQSAQLVTWCSMCTLCLPFHWTWNIFKAVVSGQTISLSPLCTSLLKGKVLKRDKKQEWTSLQQNPPLWSETKTNKQKQTNKQTNLQNIRWHIDFYVFQS